MSLNAGPLLLAGASSSKNPYLTGLVNEINTFNSIGDANKQAKANQLVRVMQVAGWYLTSKPPQDKFKNKRRWNAIRALAEEGDTEADRLGLRMLTGPTDFKTIDAPHAKQSYWLEYLDPQHRPGFQLSPQWQGWLTNAAAIANKTSFWTHINTVFNPTDVDVLVKYYPESSVYDDADHLLHFEGNDLKDNTDANYDTRFLQTHFSGRGWAIFVCSPSNKLYSGSHEAGKHHHSSFLGGGAVIAAGELVVDDGKVRVVTAKSGHYRPSAANLRNFVNAMQGIPGASIIRPDLRDIATHGHVRFHRVGHYRMQGPAAPTLTQKQVLGQLPLFARSMADPGGGNGFKAVFDRVPP